MDAPVEHLHEHRCDLWSGTAKSARENICSKQEHHACLAFRKVFAYTTRVAANQIELELG